MSLAGHAVGSRDDRRSLNGTDRNEHLEVILDLTINFSDSIYRKVKENSGEFIDIVRILVVLGSDGVFFLGRLWGGVLVLTAALVRCEGLASSVFGGRHRF